MMPAPADLKRIAAVRQRIARAKERDVSISLKIGAAERSLFDLERRGGRSSELRKVRGVFERLRAERQSLRREITTLEGELLRDRATIARRRKPEDLVANLSGDLPVALLPVRIETRFSEDSQALRIRIFPDSIHVHTHEPELTEPEQTFGREYWQTRWANIDQSDGAWQVIVDRFGPNRAAWVIRELTPTNVAELGADGGPQFPNPRTKGAAWTRPPTVEALPERWVAIGYRQGQEVFRRWGTATADALAFGPTPDPEGDIANDSEPGREAVEAELPTDEAMRWMVEYSAAERVGMAITVSNSDLTSGTLASGVDRLVVLGVDWSRSPEATADTLGELLDAQLYTEGVSVVRQGTPTNNTLEERSGFSSSGSELANALNPAVATPETTPASNGRRLASALGISQGEVFEGLPNAELREDANAGHMNNALWEATLGYFFEHMLDGALTSRQVVQLRDHFRKYVRGRGPLPAMRVGDQPYGVLPVVSTRRWRGAKRDSLDAKIIRLINDVRGLWTNASDRSPQMGRSGDTGKDLLEVLQHTPLASSIRFRPVFGPLYVANTAGLEQLASLQEVTGRLTMSMVGAGATHPRLGASVVNPHFRKLTLPFVQRGALSESEALTSNYISSTASRLRRIGGFVSIRKDDPQSLLHALLTHGAQLEMGKAAANLVAQFKFPAGSRRPKIALNPDPELVSVESAGVAADTLVRIAQRRVKVISGNRTLANHIATISSLSRVPATKTLASFHRSLRHLSRLPSAELERLLLEALDCSSHRLDAWMTSFATKRLDELRSSRPNGVHLGGFGWVENLRPNAASDSLGYIHTPSMGHAAAAAILRSGHLNHADDEASPLAVDLSSSRVREALRIIDGVRQGQPIGALLGYRLERRLRDHRPRLARYILPFRTVAPLASDEAVGTGPSETIAARDVVDGVSLLEKWKADEAKLFTDVGVTAADRVRVRSVLEGLDDRLDAVADLLVSESVYQSVLGNIDRAGAAAAALDRQTTPPEPEVVRTPRTGEDYVYRAAVIATSHELPASWSNAPIDARAAAEPRLNSWVAAILGDPARFRFAGEVLDSDGKVIEILEAGLSDLALSPLSVIDSTGVGGSGQATELEERLALHLSQLVSDPDSAAELVLLTDKLASWPRSAVSLGALLALADTARAVLAEGRHLEPADLGLPEQPAASEVDIAELTGRADQTVASAKLALEGIAAAADASSPNPSQLRGALLHAAGIGAAGAIPVALGDASEDVLALVDQATSVAAGLERGLANAAAAGSGGEGSAQITRIKAILGEGFPVAPLFVLDDVSEISASLGDERALTGGDPLAPAEWLQRMAFVQPGIGRFSRTLSYSEMCGSDAAATDLHVVQLPHRSGDTWIAATESDSTGKPVGRVSVVAHAPGGLNTSGALAGIVVDEWREVVPNRMETTGVAFHYDAPAARAPQTVLLAVPPDPSQKTWTFDDLADTVLETLEMARIRAVDPQELWMTGRFLPALYVAHNVASDTASIDFISLQAREDLLMTGRT